MNSASAIDQPNEAATSGKPKNWGGARVGAGRPAKQLGQRRLALSMTVADCHWANLHLFAQHHGLGTSDVLDRMLAQAMATEPYASFLAAWYDGHTLEQTLEHLAAGRERRVPKAPAGSPQRQE